MSGWIILIIAIVVFVVIVALVKLFMKGTIDKSKETYSPSSYSLVANDVTLTACLAVNGKLQFYEKGGVVDTLEDIQNDKVRNVVPLGSCRNVFRVEELYVKVKFDADGRLSPRSSKYNRREIEESYRTAIGATNVAGIAAQIQQDVADRKLYRIYSVTENGKVWNKGKTLEFIKALDILRRLRGIDRLGKADDGDWIMFPFVPVGNMMSIYSKKNLDEFIEAHNHRYKRRNFLRDSKLQYAPDQWPDVWQDSKWSEDDTLLIMGSDGQMRAPVEHDKKPAPHTLDEMNKWYDARLAKPNEIYKYLEDDTHHALVTEIAECQNLADQWVYVRVCYEKFVAAFKTATQSTLKSSPKDLEILSGFHFMAKMLPDGLRKYILYRMPLSMEEQILLYNTSNMLPAIQENVVEKHRLSIQQKVIIICVAKIEQIIDGFKRDHPELSDEAKSALNVVKQLLSDKLNALDFARLNKHNKKKRDAEALRKSLISRTEREKQERQAREKLEKQQKKEEDKRRKEENDKERPLYDAKELGKEIQKATVLATAMQQIFNPNQPAAQPGSEDKPSGKEDSDKKEDSDQKDDSDDQKDSSGDS